jgi:PhnB protein
MADNPAITSTTHINFRGNAREALGFYHAVFGGQLNLVTNQESGGEYAPEEADQIIWGQVADGKGFRVMGYDVPVSMPWSPGENAYFVAVEGDTAERVTEHWHKLAEGGSIVHPLAPAHWSAMYGMLKDRFGVMWVLSVVQPYGDGTA